uniref:Uncharacterized protein n=1 Tax=Leersia perrieri TaxID=77586 RepID=A0A0D9WWA6_9ORYZ
MRFAAIVSVILLIFFLGSGEMMARPVARVGKTMTTVGERINSDGVVVNSWTTESSSQPSGCTNGNGPGGYCHTPAPAGH